MFGGLLDVQLERRTVDAGPDRGAQPMIVTLAAPQCDRVEGSDVADAHQTPVQPAAVTAGRVRHGWPANRRAQTSASTRSIWSGRTNASATSGCPIVNGAPSPPVPTSRMVTPASRPARRARPGRRSPPRGPTGTGERTLASARSDTPCAPIPPDRWRVGCRLCGNHFSQSQWHSIVIADRPDDQQLVGSVQHGQLADHRAQQSAHPSRDRRRSVTVAIPRNAMVIGRVRDRRVRIQETPQRGGGDRIRPLVGRGLRGHQTGGERPGSDPDTDNGRIRGRRAVASTSVGRRSTSTASRGRDGR